MRSLWTAASGMKSQQTSMDNIANNLANINTTGFKEGRIEFQSLLYQTLQARTTDHEGEPKPTSAQIGLGVRIAAISTEFYQGKLTASSGAFDFAIQGDGFFMVEMPDGSVGYTRKGNFVMAINEGGGVTLTTSEGYPVLDTQGNEISFDSTINVSNLIFGNYGNIYYKNAESQTENLGIRIGTAQFSNPSGLLKIGDSFFAESAASGTARIEAESQELTPSVIKHKYLESSAVQAVDEMVDMIVTQRAYEMNSKAIQASDEMLQQANNLRS